MNRGHAVWLLLLLPVPVLLAGGASGCRQRSDETSTDGGDAPPFDAPAVGDGIAPLSLDFTATGCGAFDLGASRCSGGAPLTVTFSPIGSPSVTQFLWDFGDGTPMSRDRSPRHSYTLPGTFTVTLVGDGASGSLSRTHAQFIAVAAAALGQLCDVDAQCASGLRCLCGSATDCGGAFARGLCTVDCIGGACDSGAFCADLSLGTPSNPSLVAPFQRALCVPPCTDDRACAAGLRCRQLPASAAGDIHTWMNGCFPAVPADVGKPCRAPNGTLSDAACAGGQCADLGALGLCTATCDETGGCPSGSACARFGDGRLLCLRSCAAAADCGADPLLGCQAGAAAPGTLGFTVITAGAGPMACAPLPCQTMDDCQPAGVCTNGYCRAR